MFANITIRWVLIYLAMGFAVAPLVLQTPVNLSHFICALLALVLIYSAPKNSPEEKK